MQHNRDSIFYSNVNVKEAIKMETDKLPNWTGTTQYTVVTTRPLRLIVARAAFNVACWHILSALQPWFQHPWRS